MSDSSTKMSSTTHKQPTLDKAKAEMNELHKKAQADLDSLRTAPITEFEKRINSLERTLKLSQESAVVSVEEASQTSNAYIHTLETCLEQEHHRIVSLETEHRAYNEDAKAKYDDAIKELELARRRPADLQKELENVKEHSHDLQKESDDARQRTNDLSNELVDMRQHKIYLTAELEAAEQRASSMENAFSTFRSGFSQFNEHMTALTSSMKQPTQARPSSASSPPSNQQNSAEERDGDLQISNDQFDNTELTLQRGIDEIKGEPAAQLCGKVLKELRDPRYHLYNKFFMETSVPNTLSTLCSGPSSATTLDILNEKLLNGKYELAMDFQKDFDLMINDCKRSNGPWSDAYNASGKLKEIFDDTWSTLNVSELLHQRASSQSRAAGGKNIRGQKRKASTELTVTSWDGGPPRRPPGPSHQGWVNTQLASPATGVDSNPALPPPELTRPDSGWFPETGLDAWRGKITTSFSLGLDVKRSVEFTVKVKATSVNKSPSTFQAPWVEILPTRLYARCRAWPAVHVHDLWNLGFESRKDVIILHLSPSSEADEEDFEHLCNDLIHQRRWVNFSHGNIGYVKGLHLIPVSAGGVYPACLSGLDRGVLQSLMTKNSLLLVVVFLVGLPEQRLVRMAWEHWFKAVRTAKNVEAIVDARNHILHHLLPIHRQTRRRLSFGKEYLAFLEELPVAQSDPTSTTCSDHFLSLSYSNHLDSVSPARLLAAKLPSRVFVLGGMIRDEGLAGLVVVDIYERNQPVWEICKETYSNSLTGTMILLRSRFRYSWDAWESTAAATDIYDYSRGSSRRFENLGLKVERCGRSVSWSKDPSERREWGA